ncbi:GNAT family N-acetyltransferase [Amycolatopsis thermophila]|uniref:GNAT superfamily N-acetyltransferase n=1 Tax=Amycolatopsis thermophila TaxID=206084 RepID=A0ABU0EUL9_9PSEU|nr:GNAT family N-acetyltransferase [Amycolatopsis thermophila]MDQ0378973.1 GNAT superfamily N-acetyltransferase [Amycolatopsis thermophila]
MPDPVRLADADAGELLTLQRAAFVTEARAHRDLDIPPLRETLDELRAVLADPDVLTWGVRDSGRLVAAVRIRIRGEVAEVGRLAVAPDRQGHGLGSALMRAVEERLPPPVRVLRLFTGELSAGPLRLYARLGYVETGRTPEADYHLVHLEKHFR